MRGSTHEPPVNSTTVCVGCVVIGIAGNKGSDLIQVRIYHMIMGVADIMCAHQGFFTLWLYEEPILSDDTHRFYNSVVFGWTILVEG